MSKPEKIKCSMASPVWRDVDVVTRGPAVQSKMPGNPNFPNPPVDLATPKTDIEAFAAFMAYCLLEAKGLSARENNQREVDIKKLRPRPPSQEDLHITLARD